MFGLGEAPAELRALAVEMDDVAEQVRQLGSDLLVLREEIGWTSVAAEEYQASLGDRAADTARSAQLVDDVSQSLRDHADGVAETLALIESARTFLLSAVEDAKSVLSDLWSGIIETITPGVERAQEILDISSASPTVQIDLGWLESARQAGWRD